MKLMYVGNVMPLDMLKKKKLPIAGSKYEVSLIKEFNLILNGNIDVYSSRRKGQSEAQNIYNGKLLENVFFKSISKVELPLLNGITQFFNFTFILLKWVHLNKKSEKKVLILNSPAQLTIPLIMLRMFSKIDIYSLTIDTPFTKNEKRNFLKKIYMYFYFNTGIFTLKFFSGIFTLNKNAVKELNIEIPQFVTKIGYDEDNINEFSIKNYSSNKKKRIIFAGTLIYYNGIKELCDSFLLLDKSKYELHIYGSGPLESLVKEYSMKAKNIEYHGWISNESMIKVMKDADLLINIRLSTGDIDNFTFPSKLIEYFLSSTAVLSTKFNSLPNDYYPYLFLLEDSTPNKIAETIDEIFKTESHEINNIVYNGYEFILKNHNYNNIVHEMVEFMN